jgi:hypothetical protein
MKKLLYSIGLLLTILCLLGLTSSGKNKEEENKYPEITINAGADRIRTILIRELTREGYSLEKENEYQLVFGKEMGGLSGLLVGRDGQNPRKFITYVLTKEDNGTLVSARASIMYPNKNGQGNSRNVDSKKVKKELQKGLEELKAMAEKQ